MDSTPGRHRALISVGLLVCAALTACRPHPRDIEVPVESPEAFSRTGEAAAPDRWWTTFRDPQLDRLVHQAIDSNFGLRTAWARIQAARAVLDREGTALFPEIAGFAGASYVDTADGGSTEAFEVGVAAHYEIDLWGRIQSQVSAERYRAAASHADYRTVAVSVSAEVARIWFRLLESHGQLDLIKVQLETNEQVLNLVRKQFATGQAGRVDILRQQQLVEATRELRYVVESRRQVLEHQLLVLLGLPPQAPLAYQPTGLPLLPPLPQTGLPITLVQRRPDVRAALHRLEAADRDVATAISEQYPRLTLSISASTLAQRPEKLFQDWASAFAAELVAPLFDAGRRRAEVDRTEAVKNQRLYEYGQQILLAFREVEDALVLEVQQQSRIESIQAQLDLAVATNKQLRNQYIRGDAAYLDVLTALAVEQQLRRDLLGERLVLLELRVALYRALAGGFETEREAVAREAGE